MVEVTMVVLITGVLVSMGLPSISGVMSRMQLDGATEVLAGDLRRARIDAMRRNGSVYVAKKDSVTYEIQFVVGDRTLPDGVVFDAGSPDTVRFASFGPTLSPPATYSVSLGGSSNTVRVSASGLLRIN
jgi:type II secretory pathway pseudopilin PulG